MKPESFGFRLISFCAIGVLALIGWLGLKGPSRSGDELALRSGWQAVPVSLAQPFLNKAVPLSPAEEAREMPCTFVTEDGSPADCAMEGDMHRVLLQPLLSSTATVMEFGGRYGTTTCEIASIQGNSGKLVTVEPDAKVWGALKHNTATHNCDFHLLQGVLGTVPQTIVGWGYGTFTKTSSDSNSMATTFADVEKRFGLRFDTLVVDCEGCMDRVLDENPGMLTNIQLIMLELDGWRQDWTGLDGQDGEVNIDYYGKLLPRLLDEGFEIVVNLDYKCAADHEHRNECWQGLLASPHMMGLRRKLPQ